MDFLTAIGGLDTFGGSLPITIRIAQINYLGDS